MSGYNARYAGRPSGHFLDKGSKKGRNLKGLAAMALSGLATVALYGAVKLEHALQLTG